MNVDPVAVEDVAKTLYIRALKILPPDIKAGFDRLAALERAPTAQRVLAAVPGIGRGTANYFLMLLGAPGARPDRMVHRFLRDAAGHAFSDAQAESAVIAAAERLSVQPHVLAHAIWRYESSKAAGPPSP